jgi:hypothetical protein
MNETNINGYSGTVNLSTGYSGIVSSGTGNIGITTGTPSHPLTVSGTITTPGLTLQGNSTINYSINQDSNNMTPRQVNVAVFTITRDVDTNEINGTKFVKQLWVEQKNGASIDLIVAKQLDKDFDPELTIIKTLSIVNF